MAVTYQTEDVKMPDSTKRETTVWIKAVAASYGKRLGEIAYIICSDEKILEVNRQYLQHDYGTKSKKKNWRRKNTLPSFPTAENCGHPGKKEGHPLFCCSRRCV